TRWPRDWSSDVCSSDLCVPVHDRPASDRAPREDREREVFGREELAIPVQTRRALVFACVELILRDEVALLDDDHMFPGRGKLRRSEERRVGKEGRGRWA